MSDHIQIGDISPRVQYVGTGAEVDFTYSFPIFKDVDIEVYIDSSIQTLSADYLVTGVGESSGGVVTFNTAPVDGAVITLVRRLLIQRTSDFQASGEFRAKVINDELDFQIASLQQIEDDLGRAIRLKRDDVTASLELPLMSDRATKLVGFDASGNVTVSTQTMNDLEGSAEAALAAQVAQAAAETAQTGAETAETNAITAQAAAEIAQIAAETAVGGVIYNDVTYITYAHSPYVLSALQNGQLISVDTSGGAVTITLPSIAAVGDGWRISVKKTTGDGNAITIVRQGTDIIDGATTASISAAASGATYVADTDGSPDRWTSVGFGAAAGNMTDERFVAGIDYTKDTSTQLTLLGSPGTQSNVWVSFDGVWQHSDDYSLSGGTLTFSSVIPADEVFVKYGTTISVGTPADNSVSTVKIMDGAITSAKIATDSVGVDAIDTSVVATKARVRNGQTGTSYNLALTDLGGIVTMDNASANALNIVANITTAYDSGFSTDIIRLGAGVTTIDAASGVTLNGINGGSTTITDQFKAATVYRLGVDNWVVIGAVEDVA